MYQTNHAVRTVADWIYAADLVLVFEKSEAIVFTSKYKMENIRIALRGKVIHLSHSMKYLALVFDKNGNFKEHLEMMAKRMEGIMTALGRLMANIGGPREKRKKLLASVVHSVLF